MKKTELKKKLTAILMLMVMVTAVLSNTIVADAATALGEISIICYVKGNTRVTTYKSVNGAYSGYIDVNDQCTILAVYDNGWVKVRYPIANNKTKVAYTKSSNFFVDTNFSTSKISAGSDYTVYKKSNLASKLGTVYGSDAIICVATENGKQQIIYPLSGKNQYKMGFINGTISNKTATNTSTEINTSNIAQKIVAYELSQVGIGDYKGNNNVKYNTWYYGRQVSGNGYAWCMAFQSYCAKEFGVLDTAIPYENNCAEAVNWYKARNQFHYSKSRGGNYTPKAGDLVFYYSDGRINHVGMITATPVNGYLQVVEGNVQCQNGNWEVVHFTNNAKRTVNNSYVYGYATPNY